MTDVPAVETRILIGAESAADARTALRLASILALGRPAVLGGLLVVDRALEGTAALPCQRIVTASGSFMMMPNKTELRIIVESETRAFRQMLAETAAPAKARWSIDVQTGSLGSSLMEVARAWDVLVVGHRALHRRRGAVVVLTEDVSAEAEARNLGRRIAAALDTQMEEIELPAGTEVSPARLADRINRLNAAAVIVDPTVSHLPSLRHVLALLSDARCPIVVLRASGFAPMIEHSTQIPVPPGKQP